MDYLVKVRGMDFVVAVAVLCGECGKIIPAIRKAEPGQSALPGPFILPEGNRYGTAAVSYLQSRGIDADIISRCIGEGMLYESPIDTLSLATLSKRKAADRQNTDGEKNAEEGQKTARSRKATRHQNTATNSRTPAGKSAREIPGR